MKGKVKPTSKQMVVDWSILATNPNFARLWVGQLLSQIGDQALLIATLQLVNTLSDSVTALLVPALALALPQVLFGLVGGVMADRWNRQTTMIVSDILRGVVVFALLLVQFSGRLWILYLGVAGLAIIGVFFYPARNALLPNIVPVAELWSANALIQGSTMLAMIVGPALAGVAISFWGVGFAFVFDAVTFFLSATAIASLDLVHHHVIVERPSPHGVRRNLREGLRYIAAHTLLKQTLALVAAATLGVASIVLLAVRHLDEALGVSAAGYGLTLTVLGAGSLAGGMLASRLSDRVKPCLLVSSMLLIAGGAIVAFALAPSYWVVLISVALLGMSVVTARGSLDTITQLLAPDAVRGRVQAAVNMIIGASTALAEGLSALLGDLVGVRTVFLAAGTLTMAAGTAAWWVLRRFDVEQETRRGEALLAATTGTVMQVEVEEDGNFPPSPTFTDSVFAHDGAIGARLPGEDDL